MRLACVVLFVLLLVGAARADTGGSMGGGSWGGGGGGGGYSGGGNYSGGGYSSSSSSHSTKPTTSTTRSSSTYSSSGGRDYAPSVYLKAIGLLLALPAFIGLTLLLDRLNKRRSGSGDGDGTKVDVSVLRVAIDGRARRYVQTELSRIAGVATTSTTEGRGRLLNEVAMMLRKLRDAWVYVGAVNEPMRQLEKAKTTFDQHVDAARSRFREELVRNADGVTTTRASSGYTARTDEGDGLILVSLIVAARHELLTVRDIETGYGLQRALEMASQIWPSQLVAIEIVWQPADENDRMSSMELVAKYPAPELVQLPYALVGKTFCSYCSGPFPAELVTCPHCGAPAPGRELRAA